LSPHTSFVIKKEKSIRPSTIDAIHDLFPYSSPRAKGKSDRKNNNHFTYFFSTAQMHPRNRPNKQRYNDETHPFDDEERRTALLTALEVAALIMV